ncbi:MAG: tetratricopeptide repeat protein [Rhodothermales bacterium]
MATHKAPQRITRRHELREDKVITFYSRVWTFFDENRTLVFGVVGVIVLLFIIGAGFSLYQDKKADQAQTAMAAAVRAYERADYQTALDGDESNAGLLDVARQYGGTPAGNLAAYYAGDALYRQGKFEEALAYFDDFDKRDNVLGAAAYAAEAAIYENTGDFARAGERYERAASTFATDFTTPQYLLSAGRAYEKAANFSKARAMYQRISDDFPESTEAREIEYYLARVDVEAKG